MKPKNIFLIRHGESKGNADATKEIYKTMPDYAIPLTELGKEQAVKAGKQLRQLMGGAEDIFCYVSPFRRTKETFLGAMEAFDPEKVQFREDSRIREQEWRGNLDGQGFDFDAEDKRKAFGSYWYRFHGGESCADVEDRISSFLDTLHRDFQKEDFPSNVAIFGHGMSNRVFLKRWFHWTVEEFEHLANPKNCHIFQLILNEKGKYELSCVPDKYDKVEHDYHFPLRFHKTRA